MNQWTWTYDGYEPEAEGLREALLTLGQFGRFATRGALSESSADDVHYPGTYIAGIYNRLGSEIAGCWVENESLAQRAELAAGDLRRRRRGRLRPRLVRGPRPPPRARPSPRTPTRRSRLRQPDGRVLAITQRRFVSMRDPHLAGIECTLVAEELVRFAVVDVVLHGCVTNGGVARYQSAERPPRSGGGVLRRRRDHVPRGRDQRLAHPNRPVGPHPGVRRRHRGRGAPVSTCPSRVDTAERLRLELAEGTEVTLEKIVAMFTSRDDGIYEPHHASEMWASGVPAASTSCWNATSSPGPMPGTAAASTSRTTSTTPAGC